MQDAEKKETRRCREKGERRIVVCPKVKMNFSHMGDQGLIACSQKRVLRPVDGKDCSKIVNNTQPKRTGGTKKPHL